MLDPRHHRLDRAARAARADGVRIALVSLHDVENNAVRLLAAVLRRAGHHVTEIYFKDWISNHLDAATPAELDALVRVLEQRGAQLVCLSVRASAYFETAKLLTRTVQERLEIPVLWGGMHPTLRPTDSLSYADLALRGEGEGGLVDVADALRDGGPLAGIPNLWSIGRDGARHENDLRPLVHDLDVLPFRDYTSDADKVWIWHGRVVDGDPMRGDPVFQMMASRGCIYKCAFCYNSTYKKQVYSGQKWYRTRSVDSTLDEIVAAREAWPFKRIRFDDEVFNPHPDWVAEFCAKYPSRVGVPFEVFIEPKLVEEDRFRRLADAGLVGVHMGVQASERVTGHLYDRRVKNSHIEWVASFLNEVGIKPHFQLIWDDPVTNEGDFQALFELIASFPHPYDLYMFSMTVFPGSELDDKLQGNDVISRWDVEGENVRTFFQHRVNLRYPRPVEDTFWIALCVLLSNPAIPRSLIRRFAASPALRKHPWPLIQLAQASNMGKMGAMAAKMAVEGEMTGTLVRRWLSMDRLITA